MDETQRLRMARYQMCAQCRWKNFGQGRQHQGAKDGSGRDNWARCCYAQRKLPFEQAIDEAPELSREVYAGAADFCPLGKWGNDPVPEAKADQGQRQARIQHQRGGLKRLLKTALAGMDTEAASANLLAMVGRGELEPEVRAEILSEMEGGGVGRTDATT